MHQIQQGSCIRFSMGAGDTTVEDITASVTQNIHLDAADRQQKSVAEGSGRPAAPQVTAACIPGHGDASGDAAAAESYPRAANDTQLPAIFMNDMPGEGHPDTAAMDTMMGELTSLERAENERVRLDAYDDGDALNCF